MRTKCNVAAACAAAAAVAAAAVASRSRLTGCGSTSCNTKCNEGGVNVP